MAIASNQWQDKVPIFDLLVAVHPTITIDDL